MLVAAAAQQWGVDAAGITVSKGVVSHAASNRSARFGELANRASALPVPEGVPLKTPDQFTLIGTRVPKLDARAKATGTATYT